MKDASKERDAPAVRPVDPAPRLQVESWHEGGVRSLLVVAQARGAAAAFMVAHDVGERTWTAGAASLPTEHVRHGRPASALSIEMEEANRRDMADLGLIGGGAPLARRLSDFLAGVPFGVGFEEDDVPREHPQSFGYPGPLFGVAKFNVPFGPDAFRAAARLAASRLANWHERIFDDAPYFPSPGVGGMSSMLAWKAGELPAGDALVAQVADAIRSGVQNLTTPEDLASFEILGATNWSVTSHRFLARPGEVGDRRRQAGNLYRVLAPLIVTDFALRSLVDAGRPFEDALAARVRDFAWQPNRRGFCTAALRRMRTLPPGFGLAHVELVADIASTVPVNWLPRDGRGWEVAVETLGPVNMHVRDLGIELKGLAAHVGGDLARIADGVGQGTTQGMHGEDGWGARSETGPKRALREAMDMARRLGDTLVSNVRESLGLSQSGQSDRRIAGAILFNGKSFASLDRLQRRWHAGIASLEAALPSHESGNAWPEAFAPFTAPNGLQVVVLGNERDLKAEGADRADPQGVEGLSHCVGGYAVDCYRGDTHIASVRHFADGVCTRLSTIEFQISGMRQDKHELDVVQHMGRGNAAPPRVAVAAVEALRAEVAVGRITVNPQAMERNCGAGFRDSYDWREPGNLERALAAWSPYLPREIVHGGLDALRARIVAESRRMGYLGGREPVVAQSRDDPPTHPAAGTPRPR